MKAWWGICGLPKFGFVCGALLVFFGTGRAAIAQELHPTSVVVQQAIERGAKYLETAAAGDIGRRSLLALTLNKCGRPESHPKIQEAIKTIQGAVKVGAESFSADIYSTSVAIMCLVAVDPQRYRSEIETLVHSLHHRQKAEGAWGYPESHETHGKSCDTSMTQYALLALWEAHELADVETPAKVWDRAAAWALLTQDPNGGFGYQGIRAEDGENRVKQAGVRHSMTAAGMVGCYVVRDALGISDLNKRLDDDTPAALKPYESPEQRQARIKTEIPLKYFARALADGNRWMDDNYTISLTNGWQYYYLYALERYQSLKEVDRRGYLSTKEGPKWYSEGARFLLREQTNLDGNWVGQSGEVPSTCFAILFLIRSTKQNLEKSIAKRFEAGLLIAGRKLPQATDVRLRDGEVVEKPLEAPVEQVLSIAADPNHRSHNRAREALADLARSGQRDVLVQHGSDLTLLAMRGTRTVRLLAIEAIGRSRNLELVPLLIYLLRDADVAVVHAANDALGGISRRFSQIQLDASPSDSQRDQTIEAWKQWFVAIRPDVEIDSYDPLDVLP